MRDLESGESTPTKSAVETLSVADGASRIGDRVCIYGIGGKTSLSRAVGASKGLPVIELDAMFWLPNWVERDREELRTMVLTRLDECADGWVLDGNYSSIAASILPRADTVVWLNMSRSVTAGKLLWRTITNYVGRKRICGDNYERLTGMFQPVWWRMMRGSQIQARAAQRLAEAEHPLTVIEVKNYRDLNELYRLLGEDPARHRT